jgi:hypothetical protein
MARRSRIKHPISRGPRPNYKRGTIRALLWTAFIIAISAVITIAEQYLIERRAHASTTEPQQGIVADARRDGAG